MLDLHKWHNALDSLGPQAAIPEVEVEKAQILSPPVTIGPHKGTELYRFSIPIDLDAYGFNIWISTRYKWFFQEGPVGAFEQRITVLNNSLYNRCLYHQNGPLGCKCGTSA
jgi:hypothetical protein